MYIYLLYKSERQLLLKLQKKERKENGKRINLSSVCCKFKTSILTIA